LKDGKIALVDRAKERFFVKTAADSPEVFGPFSAQAVTHLVVRDMSDTEKSAYLALKSSWDA